MLLFKATYNWGIHEAIHLEEAIPLTTWEKMFRNYLQVINAFGDEWPEARTRALLLHCLGTEGQHIFYTVIGTGDTLDSAIVALQTHFNPKINIVAERHAIPQTYSNTQ